MGATAGSAAVLGDASPAAGVAASPALRSRFRGISRISSGVTAKCTGNRDRRCQLATLHFEALFGRASKPSPNIVIEQGAGQIMRTMSLFDARCLELTHRQTVLTASGLARPLRMYTGNHSKYNACMPAQAHAYKAERMR